MDVEIASISEELTGIELISLVTSSAVGGDSVGSGVPVKTGSLTVSSNLCQFRCWPSAALMRLILLTKCSARLLHND